MQVVARAKDTGVSDKKLLRLAEFLRGKPAEEALTQLRFFPSPHARLMAKVVKSAVANAENNYQLSRADLKIARVVVDRGPILKRFRPRARGRISPILKRSSHITVVVEG